MTHPLSPNPASPKTAEDANCFALEVSRDLEGADTFEVIVEITNVEPPDKSVGCGGLIEIESYALDGRNFQLSMLEHERAIKEAITYMERQAEISENEFMDR